MQIAKLETRDRIRRLRMFEFYECFLLKLCSLTVILTSDVMKTADHGYRLRIRQTECIRPKH